MSQAVPYNEKLPSTIYFQDGCVATHLQSGRVYDAIGNQKRPDILELWGGGHAVPFDLQQALINENVRMKIEKEMAEKFEAMQAEAQANLDRVNREIHERQERDRILVRGPLPSGQISSLPQPNIPQPQVLPEMLDLPFLNQLVPVQAQQIPNYVGLGIPQQPPSRIREIPEIPGYAPGMKG